MRITSYFTKGLLCLGLFLGGGLGFIQVNAQTDPDADTDSLAQLANAKKFNNQLQQSNNPSLLDTIALLTNIPISGLKKTPFLTTQQYLKGNAAGLFVREESGEPGTEQFMYIRGISTPMFTKQDLYSIQPVVYVNGVPLAQENALSYNIQRYDFNKIGSGTNMIAGIDPHNIESIEVLKTPADLAKLGPLGSNGAIWITTKNAKSGYRQFNVDTYVGLLQKPDVYTVNADYESAFRQPYYDKFATLEQIQNMAVYVKNANDSNYYGPSDWNTVYYRSKPVYYFGAGLLGGTERANFMFNMSVTKDQNFDATNLGRYSVLFGINMMPIKWLTISGYVNATRMQRERNKSLRERFAETRFVPDLTNPISPNVNSYNSFLNKYRGSVDDNKNNTLFGGFSATAKLGNFDLKSVVSIDYEESLRDAFFGKPLMDGNSFLSTYFGFNQRTSIQNSVKYSLPLADDTHTLQLEAGHNYIADFFRYNYVIGYNTPNDFIKVKEIYIPSGSIYEDRVAGIFAYPFTDAIKSNLSSIYGRLGYSFRKILDLNGVIRYDGYSSFAETARWLLTPVASARLNINEIMGETPLSTFSLKGSWGIFGKLLQDSRFKIGPQYRVDLGYADEPTLGSYAGLAGLSQPYSEGWINKYYNWPFTRKLDVGFDVGLNNDDYILGVSYYQNKDKNMIVPVTMPAEAGFAYKYVQGMEVENRGINVTTFLKLLKREDFNWDFYANFSWLTNRLTTLPYNSNSIIYGNRKIEIGERVDAYWIFENKGIINTTGDIPRGKLNADGSYDPLSFSGMINFQPGDAIWNDINGDGTINNADKVLKGHFMPNYTGGFGSNISYKQFSLDFQFYYGLGHQLLNQSTANKLDFINNENSRNITYIKEVTFWQKTFDYSDYPLYNPWSSTIPYRLDQDLFLEDADFLKLRHATLGYDLAGKVKNFSKFLIYVTGSNLLTVTPFKSGDPEQYDYQGIYSGRYLPIPRSYTIGLKLNF